MPLTGLHPNGVMGKRHAFVAKEAAAVIVVAGGIIAAAGAAPAVPRPGTLRSESPSGRITRPLPLIQAQASAAGSAARSRPGRSRILPGATFPQKHFVDGRGLYRVFNAAEFRLFRSSSGPPNEADTPFTTTPTLPHEPADTYADGVWHLGASYFNGLLDSGFLIVNLAAEAYQRLDLDAAAVINRPPYGPTSFELRQAAGGVIHVLGQYFQVGSLRATQWAITYTTDGSEPGTPPAVSPTITVTMLSSGIALLDYALAAQVQDTTVKVRLQTRRLDGAVWRYSENSTVLTVAGIDIQGADPPPRGGGIDTPGGGVG